MHGKRLGKHERALQRYGESGVPTRDTDAGARIRFELIAPYTKLAFRFGAVAAFCVLAGSAWAAAAQPHAGDAPPPCPARITVTLHQSYGKGSFAPYSCDLGSIGATPSDAPTPWSSASPDIPVTGSATLKFADANIEIDYRVTQGCILTTYGVLYNDNIAVQLRWPAVARDPFLPPALTRCHEQVPAPVLGPLPGAARSGAAALPDTAPRFIVAYADANQVCGTNVNGSPGDVTLCKAQNKPWSSKDGAWEGSLSLPIAALQANRLPARFSLAVIRNLRAGVDPNNGVNLFRSRTVDVTIETKVSVAGQQYVAAAPDTGHASDLPPHRTNANAHVPLGVNVLAAGTVADDAGQMLSLRNSSVGQLKDTGAKKLVCRSCGSFQTDDKQPFQQPFTSATTLGLDLSSLGVDSVPFSFSSASYPIDWGYKLLVGGSTALNIASFGGTTKASGIARDTVVSALHTTSGDATQLSIGLFHAVANRSEAVLPLASHSTNTQASLAYSFSPEARQVIRSGGIQNNPALTFSTLVRYGTEYGMGSQVVDIAESIQKTPPALDVFSAASELWHFSGALGYRNVGARYNPIDGTFDPHTGQHGPYAEVQYTDPVRKAGFETATIAISGYEFADGTIVRDKALFLQVKYPISRLFSLQSNETFGRVALSQVGRVNNIVVTDGAGGRGMLPNGQYNAQLAYTPNVLFQLTLGYTQLQAQGCNPKLVAKVQPCYAYRAPTAVSNVAWSPFPKWTPLADAFVEAALQGSTSTPFQTATDNVLQTQHVNYYDTTNSHVVRTAAFGMHLFKGINKCSTLLLTSVNRGGDVDLFAKSAPVPGFTNTASLEVVPGSGWPSFLVAYSRVVNRNATTGQGQFLLRTQFGLPLRAYGAGVTDSCKSGA